MSLEGKRGVLPEPGVQGTAEAGLWTVGQRTIGTGVGVGVGVQYIRDQEGG